MKRVRFARSSFNSKSISNLFSGFNFKCLILTFMLLLWLGCASTVPVSEEDSFEPEVATDSASAETQEFDQDFILDDFEPEQRIENELAQDVRAEQEARIEQDPTLDPSQVATTEAPVDEFSFFEEPAPESSQVAETTPLDNNPVADEFAEFDSASSEFSEFSDPVDPSAEVAPQEPSQSLAGSESQSTPDEFAFDDASEPLAVTPEPSAEISEPVAEVSLNQIKEMQFKGAESGGTLVIRSDRPAQFQERFDEARNQMVIDIEQANIPRNLQRPFITKEFDSIFGAINAYQNGDKVSVVIDLNSSNRPVIESFGNELMVIAQPSSGQLADSSSQETQPAETSVAATAVTEPEAKTLLGANSMAEFLSGNRSFVGGNISITVVESEVRDIIRLLAEAGKINVIVAEGVAGKMSLRLRDVPWDQALLMVMKTRKLGYSRLGNVLRIAPVAELREEEEEALKALNARKASEDLEMKTIPLNYSKIEDIEKQVKPLLTARGQVIIDARTSNVIIADIPENVTRAESLIRALDVPPPQVLIESRVVEASDEFTRNVGVNWQTSGRTINLGGDGANRLTASLPLQNNPALGGNVFGLNFTLGTLDVIGSLDLRLRLSEQQGSAKVIASPRIVTLHNEKASMNQTVQIPIPVTNNTAGGITQSFEFRNVSLNLEVTPLVTNDGSIIMQVSVTRQSLGSAQGGQAPINSSEAKTRVIVKSSQTAVIGGIYQDRETENENRTPWLGQVPFVSWLFRSSERTISRSELLVFLTPRILGRLENIHGKSESLDGVF